MKKQVKNELWPAPWFIRGVLTVFWLGGIAVTVALLFKSAYAHALVSFVVFAAGIYYVSVPFRRYGSKFFSREAIHLDNNLVEMDVAGIEFWNNDPAISDYFGSLDLVAFNGFYVSDLSVSIQSLVQRLAICVKVEFDGTDPEKTLNLFRSIRVLDSSASVKWKNWLRNWLQAKVRNVVTTLAINGELSRFFHEDMDGELNELIQNSMKPELDLAGGGFLVKASYDLLGPSEKVDQFYLSEAADKAFASQVERIRGLHPVS